MQNRIALVMDGSRRHYDVADTLYAKGCLDRMFADWYALPWSPSWLLSKIVKMANPMVGKRMLERFSSNIPGDIVCTNPMLALRLQFGQRKSKSIEEYFRWCSQQRSRWIEREGFGEANGLYGFIRNIAPETCEKARQHQLRVVGEQMIAPAAVEEMEQLSQQERWPNWEAASSSGAFQIVRDYEENTWSQLDRIVAPSQYVIDGLIDQGVEQSRIDLVRYPADFGALSYVDRSKRDGRITVGFVGHVNLRKNAPVFLQLARRLPSDKFRFVMVGKSSLLEHRMAEFQDVVEFTGAVPRSEIARKLESFDIFLFPSTCEGSAGVVLEAMATGLPIVTTPNSGSLVTDGAEGFVCQPDDIDALTSSVQRLADPELRHSLGQAAAARVGELTLDAYGRNLVQVFDRCHGVCDEN